MADGDRATPAGLVIRAAAADDYPGITELLNLPGARWGTLRPPYQTVAQVREWHERQAANGVTLVALMDGRVAGHCGLSRMPVAGRTPR